MKIDLTPIDKLIPYARNPRKNQAAIAKVAASINEFGFRQPIVTDSEMVVVAGHTRLEAARMLGFDRVPVHIAEGLTRAQVAAYRLADNRTGEDAEWDRDLLAIELSDLVDEINIALTGFNEAEIAEYLTVNTESLEHWGGMPEFTREDKTAFLSFRIHFKDQAAVDSFAELVGQNITDKTRYLWFPYIEIETCMDKVYAGES